jgi:hypothetical protein
MKIIKDLSLKLVNWYSLAVLLSVWISASMVADDPNYLLVLLTTVIVIFFLIADCLISVKITSPLVTNKYVLYSLIFFIAGLLLSLILSQFIFFFLLIIGGLLYVQRYLSEQLYFVNIIILSLLAGCTFWLSGMAIKSNMISFLPGSIFPSIIIFLYTAIYLIIDESIKISENRSKMIIPFIQKITASQSILTAIIILFAMILLSYWPILNNWYSNMYKIIFVYVIELPLLGFLIFAWGNPIKGMLSIAQIIMKLNIVLGFTALFFA